MSVRRGPRPTGDRLKRLLVMLPWLMERGEVSVEEACDRFDLTEPELVKDLDTRYRWDLYWMAGGLHGVLPDVTHDYKDAHIDTALRRIVAPLRNATPTEEGN